MMTELLLGLYPDVFKGGSSMAGMPAGCRGTNETGSGGGYSGACAGGSVTHTSQEWGDIVRKMYPGYTGHRPRVQLFHGDADTTIRYANHTEAIKEWTDLLGLDTNPTSTETGITLGTRQAKRQHWRNSCGYLVLDAFTSIGGDHGPPDALFLAQYLVPSSVSTRPVPSIRRSNSAAPPEPEAALGPEVTRAAVEPRVPAGERHRRKRRRKGWRQGCSQRRHEWRWRICR
jgi:hypothetical protein